MRHIEKNGRHLLCQPNVILDLKELSFLAMTSALNVEDNNRQLYPDERKRIEESARHFAQQGIRE